MPSPAVPHERDLVFNVVWTGTTFPSMRCFVQSLMAHTEARFRFVANCCPPEQVERMEAFRALHPDQVVEVLPVSPDVLESHGFALEQVRTSRDDGEWFAFVDPDIKANRPWVADLTPFLADAAVVTSGTEVWSDDNLVPEGHIGVAGEHFIGRNGFVFGTPHLSIYRREALDATCARWGVYFGTAGPDLSEDAREALRARGALYVVYDTAKVVNALLQVDGHGLVHHDIPQLVHIGGLAHYISPSGYVDAPDGERAPEWTRWGGSEVEMRHAVTRFTTAVLEATLAGRPPPEVPPDADGPMAAKLELARREVIDMVARYGDEAEPRR